MVAPVNSRDIYLQSTALRLLDNGLSREEKPAFIELYKQILAIQVVLDANATKFGVTTEKTTYDTAISALTSYLGTLLVPVPWNDVSNITLITRATFVANFDAVNTARKALELAINVKSAITGSLTNPTVALAADAVGTVSDITKGNGTFKVFSGSTDVTGVSVTYSRVSQSGLDISISATTGLYTLNSMSADSGTAVLRAIYAGFTIDLTYTAVKAKSGSSAPLLYLSATTQTMTYSGADVAVPASQTITFVANLSNVTGTATFTATRYDAAGSSLGTIFLGGSGNTRTLTNTQFYTSSTICVVVIATLGALSDTITIVKLRDGASSLSGYLTNESHTVPTASDGSAPDFTGASGTFKVYLGLVDVTSGCSFSVISSTYLPSVPPAAGAGSYVVSSAGSWPISSNVTSITYRAVYTGNVIDKIFSIAKSRSGVQGNIGNTGTTGSSYRTAYLASAVATASTSPSSQVDSGSTSTPGNNTVFWGLGGSWVTTVPSLTAGQFMYQSDGIYNPTANTTTWSIPYWSTLKVGSLSAITANIGAITSGTINSVDITAGTFKTSASGKRIVINESGNNQVYFYNASGVVEAAIGGTSGSMFASNGTEAYPAVAGYKTTSGIPAVFGSNTTGVGVEGSSTNSYGGKFTSSTYHAVSGVASSGGSGAGGQFSSTSGAGVSGSSSSGAGGLFSSTTGYAGYFQGSLAIGIDGPVYATAKAGTGGEVRTNSVFPATDNVYTCGYNSVAWSNIYSHNALTIVSDARTKTEVQDCDLGLSFINSLRPVSWKAIVGGNIVTDAPEEFGPWLDFPHPKPAAIITTRPGIRRHYGMIAQEVKQTLGDKNAGMWVLSDTNDLDSRQALRYEEFIAPLIKAIQELSAEVEHIKTLIV